MAVFKSSKNEIPAGAIRLTEQEAEEYQLRIVGKFQPQYEMWPILYGPALLVGTSGVTAFSIGHHFGRSFGLPFIASFSVALPIIVSSTMANFFFQSHWITSDVLLTKTPCLPCVQGRSSLVQGVLSSLFPTFMGTLGCALMTQRLDKMYIPPIREKPAEFVKVCQQAVRQKSGLLAGLCIFNMVLASVVVALQQRSIRKLQEPPQP